MSSLFLQLQGLVLTNELRGMLDKWEATNGTSSNNFDAQANADYKERCAKIEADLDRVEAQITQEATRSKIAKSE